LGIHNPKLCLRKGVQKIIKKTTLAKTVFDCHGLLMRVPEASRWGEPARIWPTGNAWVKQKQDLSEMVGDWRGLIDEGAFPDKLCIAWEKVADHLAEWVPGKSLKPKSSVVFDRAVAGLSEMEQGDWELPFDGDVYSPSKKFCQKLARLLRHCVACELETKLIRTKGIHSLLSAFEEVYDVQVRRAGRLTFSDLPMLLAPREGQAVLGGNGPDQIDIGCRLDGAFDRLVEEILHHAPLYRAGILKFIEQPVVERTVEAVLNVDLVRSIAAQHRLAFAGCKQHR
jgi:hypothetical protein